MRVAPKITLTRSERAKLQRLANGRRTEVRVVMRARIILAAARGLENREIAEEVGVTRETVGRWRSRYAENGLEGIRVSWGALLIAGPSCAHCFRAPAMTRVPNPRGGSGPPCLPIS